MSFLKRGYFCIKENSREIIENELKNNGDILPWKNQMAFENKVCLLRKNKLINSPSEKICFLTEVFLIVLHTYLLII